MKNLSPVFFVKELAISLRRNKSSYKTLLEPDSPHKTQVKFYGLDHLRALAIAYVFLFHYFILSGDQPAWLPGFAAFGWTGVDLFFVLSGFLIAAQLFEQVRQNQVISFRVFFLKRFFRIIPAYLVTVGLYFVFPLFREKEALPPFWKFITFTQNIGLNLKDYGTFSHAWSLCVEEHFYLLLPLIVMALQYTGLIKKSAWLIIMLFILGVAMRLYSYNSLYLPHIANNISWMYWYKYIYYPTWNRLDGLLAGVSIAALYRFYPYAFAKISKYGNLCIIAGLTVVTAAYFLCKDQRSFSASVFGYPIIALGYGLLVMGAISPAGFLYRWQSKVTSFIAALSFAIYLMHKGIIHITHRLLEGCNINSNLMLLISIATCILAAYLLHITVEKPFMKLRHKIIR